MFILSINLLIIYFKTLKQNILTVDKKPLNIFSAKYLHKKYFCVKILINQ